MKKENEFCSKSKIKFILIGAAAIFIVIAAVFGIKGLVETSKYNKMSPVLIAYSNGGNMEGGYLRLSLKKGNDGKVVFESVEAENWQADEKTVTKTLSDSEFNELYEIMLSYKFYRWKNSPQRKIQALDASTTTIEVLFSNGEKIIISSGQILLGKSGKFYTEIYEYLKSFE